MLETYLYDHHRGTKSEMVASFTDDISICEVLNFSCSSSSLLFTEKAGLTGAGMPPASPFSIALTSNIVGL